MQNLLTNLQAWWDCQVMMANGMCEMCTTMMGCC
ncbi:hypothetical protein RHRU231_480076 [Rhodococcus ruber]|uniref:Uncharacterized protein n=1 Tax=Rhodococcus ruber TaxID=1830 RepID=A0A098BLF2_9NOCA|nr:hypothetical protein RHRU231_480076 [Rhodococcus ruber]